MHLKKLAIACEDITNLVDVNDLSLGKDKPAVAYDDQITRSELQWLA